MATLTVRMNRDCHSKLQELAKQTHQPMVSVLEQAVEEYRRKQIFDKARAAYEHLRKNRKAWKEELKERALWEGTLGDGLVDE